MVTPACACAGIENDQQLDGWRRPLCDVRVVSGVDVHARVSCSCSSCHAVNESL